MSEIKPTTVDCALAASRKAPSRSEATRALAAITLSIVAAGPCAPAIGADKWPDKPIEIYYPYPPGNTTDNFMRLLAQGMSKRLGVPVQVINKPGGGGVVGTAAMVKSSPDGYVIGSWTPGPGISQIIAGAAPYSASDIQPIAGVFLNTFVLAADGKVPATNLAQFADYAKKQGKPIVIASYSPASVPGLMAARIAKRDGWPYKVVAFPNPSAKELTAGDAVLSTTGANMVSSFAKSGDVKVLSAWTPERTTLYPDVATLKETGHGDMYLWTGLAAPAGTPRPIIDKLAAAAKEALTDPEVKDYLVKSGTPPFWLGTDDTVKRIAEETGWMRELMTELGFAKK